MNTTLNQLDHWIKNFPKAVLGLTDADLTAKPNPKKWSKKEILGHLIDSAQYNLQRFTTAPLATTAYQVIPYPQSELVDRNQYQNAELPHLVQLWQSLNQQIHHVCTNLSATDLKKAILLPDQQEVDLAFLIKDYLTHFEYHLAQILPPDESSLGLTEPDGINYQTAHQRLQAVLATQKFVTLFRHGSMYVELYAPEKEDLQQPHEQDELYVIISGSGTFFKAGKRFPFQAGDVIFVGAGKVHRFEDFTSDFQTWVVFYGPLGGE